ncbi:hypothetical protein FNYG_08909 [Fusarium nygamai]|uniref:Uncharacterized protein n=1 Tax=Gibberella nygamai TaxID=42673 RepID=A0A2K0W6D3_GIBNY|nr:hypothetical protein FNYG_08909 [Fusarium nygamai]
MTDAEKPRVDAANVRKIIDFKPTPRNHRQIFLVQDKGGEKAISRRQSSRRLNMVRSVPLPSGIASLRPSNPNPLQANQTQRHLHQR